MTKTLTFIFFHRSLLGFKRNEKESMTPKSPSRICSTLVSLNIGDCPYPLSMVLPLMNNMKVLMRFHCLHIILFKNRKDGPWLWMPQGCFYVKETMKDEDKNQHLCIKVDKIKLRSYNWIVDNSAEMY